jgi:hypothetical protein
LDADDAEVVRRHDETFERLAAVGLDQEIERPRVRRKRVERRRLLLPFSPLHRRPAAWTGGLAVDPRRGNQGQPAGILIGRRREQDALNQAEDRHRGSDAQGEREDGDDGEARLLEQHAHRNA